MSKHSKRLSVIMLAVIMTVMMVFPSCSGSSETSGGIQQNVRVARSVYVDPSGIMYFGYGKLICTAVLKDGTVSEFTPEGAVRGEIYAMTVYDDALYISSTDGLYRYPLEIFTNSDSDATIEQVLGYYEAPGENEQFEIFDGKVFFLREGDLYCVPAEGGETTKAASDVKDFEVSDKGVYYLSGSGSLTVMSPDFSESRNIADCGSANGFTVNGMDLIYNDGEHVMALDVTKEEARELTTEYKPHASCLPWSNGTDILYYNSDWKALITGPGDEDTEVGDHSYPGKFSGYQAGDQVIYLTGDRTNRLMRVFDLAKAASTEYDVAAEIKAFTEKNGGDSDPEPQTGDVPDSSAGGYDVMTNFTKTVSPEGDIQYLYFNDFMLMLPNADDITYEAKGDSVDIIFVPGKNAGYGGKLVTIAAYDPDDDSYTGKPDYHVAGVGQNTGKRFVAIYPTDLQCSPEYESVVARYKELKDYLYKIGEGSVNSPLATADSNPEP